MKPTLTAEQKLRCLHGTFAAMSCFVKRLLAITESSDIVFSKYEVYSTAQSLD